MKVKIVLFMVLSALYVTSHGQTDSPWEKWNWLEGEWVGEGGGEPGQGGGTFSFTFELNKNILVRRSHTELKFGENNPTVIHEDLTIIYSNYRGAPLRAISFDNEGHTINYAITYPENSIVMTSEKIPGVPVFRLTYTPISDKIFNTRFEMAREGEEFATYIEGKSRKTE